MAETIVDTDFHQWALDTAEAINKRQLSAVDWDRVAEEIYSLGRSEENELRSRLAQLMYHLLKKRYQPDWLTRSWELTIKNQRKSIAKLLEQQPSLKTRLAGVEAWDDAYRDALSLSGPENLPDVVVERFPAECPFTIDIIRE